MTAPPKYSHHFMPVKYFLSSYRALSDGRGGIRRLEEDLRAASFMLSDWKVTWAGTCAILRVAIDLFKADAKSCIASSIRDELAAEWRFISNNRSENDIFWEFLKRERDNIVHGYKWQSYEAWINPDGTFRENRLSLLTALNDDEARTVIMMKGGTFDGENSLELLRNSADWVEERIYSAIRRAGFDPDERRNLVTFQTRSASRGLLSSD